MKIQLCLPQVELGSQGDKFETRAYEACGRSFWMGNVHERCDSWWDIQRVSGPWGFQTGCAGGPDHPSRNIRADIRNMFLGSPDYRGSVHSSSLVLRCLCSHERIDVRIARSSGFSESSSY